MSAVQIGRVTVDCPENPVEIGDTWSFTFDVGSSAESVDEVLWRMSALRGIEVGETIPVVWSDDSRLTGFYRLSSPVVLESDPAYLTTGYVRGEVTLTRVSGPFGLPRVELVNTETNRATISGVNPTDVVWIPVERLGATGFKVNDAGGFDQAVRLSSDGSVLAYAGNASHTHTIHASDYYASSARVEIRRPDGVWRPAVGMADSTDDISAIRLSNGVCRFYLGTGAIVPSVYSLWGDEWPWSSATELATVSLNTSADSKPYVRIVRNTPEAVSVGYEFGAGVGRATVTLRRGDRYVTIGYATTANRSFFTASAETLTDGGAYNSDVVIAGEDSTPTGLSEGVALTSVSTVMVGIPTSDSDSKGTADELIDQWFAGVNTRQVVRS